MKLRIGDLVYYNDQRSGCGGKGLVSALTAHWLALGCIEVIEKGESIRSIIQREIITEVVPREYFVEWWKLL